MGRDGRPSREIRLPAKLRDDDFVELGVKRHQKLYCICRQPYEEGAFMIACDSKLKSPECYEWCHGNCAGITPEEAQKIESYVCPACVGLSLGGMPFISSSVVKRPRSLRGAGHKEGLDEKTDGVLAEQNVDQPTSSQNTADDTQSLPSLKLLNSFATLPNHNNASAGNQSLPTDAKFSDAALSSMKASSDDQQDKEIASFFAEESLNNIWDPFMQASDLEQRSAYFSNESGDFIEDLKNQDFFESFQAKDVPENALDLGQPVENFILHSIPNATTSEVSKLLSTFFPRTADLTAVNQTPPVFGSSVGNLPDKQAAPKAEECAFSGCQQKPMTGSSFCSEKCFLLNKKEEQKQKQAADTQSAVKRHVKDSQRHQSVKPRTAPVNPPVPAVKEQPTQPVKAVDAGRQKVRDALTAALLTGSSEPVAKAKTEERCEKDGEPNPESTGGEKTPKVEGNGEGQPGTEEKVEEKANAAELVLTASKVGEKIEISMFKLFGGLSKKYKDKTRSLLFNLKDKKNVELREKVLKEEIGSEELCQMTAEQLANKELTEWRTAKAEQREHQIVVTEEAASKWKIVKKTHKGEVVVNETKNFDEAMAGPADFTDSRLNIPCEREKATSAAESESETAQSGEKPGAGDVMQPESEEKPSSTKGEESGEAFADEHKTGEDEVDELRIEEYQMPEMTVEEVEKEEAGFDQNAETEPGFGVDLSPVRDIDEVIQAGEASASKLAEEQRSQTEKASLVKEKVASKKERVPPAKEKILSPRVNNIPFLWKGQFQLSSSRLSSVGLVYRSGEKLPLDDCMTDVLEVKGLVKLDAMEKFLKDLGKSTSRYTMIVDLVFRPSKGSSDKDIRQVLAGWRSKEKVGFVELMAGAELYLMSPSAPTKGMLEKYGHQSGRAANDGVTDDDILMVGSLIRRKSFLPSTWKPSVSKAHVSRTRVPSLSAAEKKSRELVLKYGGAAADDQKPKPEKRSLKSPESPRDPRKRLARPRDESSLRPEQPVSIRTSENLAPIQADTLRKFPPAPLDDDLPEFTFESDNGIQAAPQQPFVPVPSMPMQAPPENPAWLRNTAPPAASSIPHHMHPHYSQTGYSPAVSHEGFAAPYAPTNPNISPVDHPPWIPQNNAYAPLNGSLPPPESNPAARPLAGAQYQQGVRHPGFSHAFPSQPPAGYHSQAPPAYGYSHPHQPEAWLAGRPAFRPRHEEPRPQYPVDPRRADRQR